MYQLREPLITLFLGLYFQLFLPSQPDRQVVGIDFGEPTRNCAGRGQICRIEALEAQWANPPEALGETWDDSLGGFHLSIQEVWWDAETDSLRQWLWVPGDASQLSAGYYRGSRSDGRISFFLTTPKQ